MERESLPPSIAIPVSSMMSRIASAQSYISAPSPSIFAAHIQLPDAWPGGGQEGVRRGSGSGGRHCQAHAGQS
eukprot:6565086-Pyramimonas_sp.AAC.1